MRGRIAKRHLRAEMRQRQNRMGGMRRKGTGTEILQGEHRYRWSTWGRGMLPPELNTYLPDFNPEHAHLLLQGVYGEFLHQNDRSHLDRGVADATI